MREIDLQRREVADPTHPRRQVDPMLELREMDVGAALAAEDEREAVGNCDSMCAMLDPVGTAVGSAGPDPIEFERGLLDTDPDPFDLL